MPTKPKPKPRQRRARGTGTIFRDETRGVWVGRVPTGRNADGSTRYVERSDASQSKLVEKLKAAGPPGPETTVNQWCDKWLTGLDLRPGSRLNYEKNVRNHIKPQLGHLRIRDLTPHQIDQARKVWAKSLGPNTIRTVMSELSACLSTAVRAKLIPSNPIHLATKPKSKKSEIDPFTPDEMKRIIAEAVKKRTTRVIAVLAAVGCRVGESLALDISDWDSAEGAISITKTVQAKPSFGLGPPKTVHGVRVVRVPRPHTAVLGAIGSRKRGPLFATSKGNRPAASMVRRNWFALLARLGLKSRNLHQLRHTVATHMIAGGAPIGDVAKYLGDTSDTIVKTYLHPTGTDPSLVIERLWGG